MREPTGIEVSVPIVDFELCVGHAENGQVLLDGGCPGRAVGKDSDVDMVGKGRYERPHVACFGPVIELTVETDVVSPAVFHDINRKVERSAGPLLGLKLDGATCIGEVNLATVCRVGDLHEEFVVSSKHTVGHLDVPVVRESTINREHAGQVLVFIARKHVRFSNFDVNGLHGEYHTLDVV